MESSSVTENQESMNDKKAAVNSIMLMQTIPEIILMTFSGKNNGKTTLKNTMRIKQCNRHLSSVYQTGIGGFVIFKVCLFRAWNVFY